METVEHSPYLLGNNELNELESLSKNLENWIETGKYEMTEEDSSQNCYSLRKDPLLSQVQLVENAASDVDTFEPTIDVSETTTTRKHKVKESGQIRAKFLKNVNTKNTKIDHNMNSLGNSNKKYKDEILNQRPAATLEMIFIRNGVGLIIKDNNGAQIFLIQHIGLSAASRPSIRQQVVKSINLQPICDKTKIKLPQLITNVGSKVHLCPVRDCTEAFLQPAIAKNHALRHLGVKPFNCTYPDCKWEFYKENHLNRHLTTHEGQKNYVCDEPGCNKDFTTIYNLNEHKKKRHIEPATIPCPVLCCEEVFRNDKELLSHCKMHNESEAPLHCSYDNCTRSFFTKASLDMHLRNHQYGSTYICNFPNCGKVCNTAYRLKEHIRSHTGSRPYICTFEGCKWRFTTASKLRRHQRTHKEWKNFQCTVEGCNKAYKRSEHLKHHFLTHVEVPEKVEISQTAYTAKSVNSKRPHIQEKCQSPSQKFFGVISTNASVFNINYCSDEPTSVPSGKSEDELLEEAIKSLGVPEMMLEEELLHEPLDFLGTEDFSTVNLKDLD